MKRSREEEGGTDQSNKNIKMDGEETKDDEQKAMSDAEGAENEINADKSESELFYEKKLGELEAEAKSVEDGTHSSLQEGTLQLQATRDKLLHRAEVNKQLREREVEALYSYDCKAAKESYNNALDDLKSSLLAEIKESEKRLVDLRDGVNDAEVRSSSRKLRSKKQEGSKKGGSATQADNDATESKAGDNADGDTSSIGTPTPAGYGPESLGINFFMSASNVWNDLKAMQKDWRERAEKFLDAEKVQEKSVRVEDSVLYFNQFILEKGQSVECTTEVTNEEIYGKIQGISPTEIIVKVNDGTQTRVLVTHLRSGRCTIAPSEKSDN